MIIYIYLYLLTVNTYRFKPKFLFIWGKGTYFIILVTKLFCLIITNNSTRDILAEHVCVINLK